MAIRLLHLADLHLGSNGGFHGDRGEVRRKDFQVAFERAVDFALAVETRVDAVLICGDLFDTHSPPPPLLRFVHEQLGRLREHDIPTVLIPGFHDAFVYPDCVYRNETFPGTHLLLDPDIRQPISFEFKGVPVHFYGFAWNEPQKAPAESFERRDMPGLHVALLHGDIQNDDGTVPDVPVHFRRQDLEATGMHYVALGYRHVYEVANDKGSVIVYPGSLEAVDADEVGARAFLVVSFELEADPQLTLTQVPYKSRPVSHQVIDVSTLDAKDHASLAGALMQYADPNAIARIELIGTTEFIIDADRLRDLLSHHFFHLAVEDQTVFSVSSVAVRLETERTIRGLFTGQVRSRMNDKASPDDQAVLEYALKSGLQRFLEGELL